VKPQAERKSRRCDCDFLKGLLDSIKVEANKRDMPYQSLIKVWLAKEVQENRR